MEAGILTRDLVPHRVFKNTVVDKRHSEYKGSRWKGNKRVVEPDDSDPPFGFIGSGHQMSATQPCQQTHVPPVHNHDISHHGNTPMIHASLPFPMHSIFCVSPLYVFSSSLRLIWLADPALVTSVYPNQMQYTPCVLQEASLLDGVDASVRGNGRRFSKTSSYPPCRRYAFILFYPYFLTTSSSPLFSLIHSFSRPTSPRVTL